MPPPQPSPVSWAAGFALGLAVAAAVLSWIPIINMLAFPFAVAAVVSGIVAVVHHRRGRRGMGLTIAAFIVAVAACGVTVAAHAAFTERLDSSASNAGNDLEDIDKGLCGDTDQVLKNHLDVEFGKLTFTDKGDWTATGLPVTMTTRTPAENGCRSA